MMQKCPHAARRFHPGFAIGLQPSYFHRPRAQRFSQLNRFGQQRPGLTWIREQGLAKTCMRHADQPVPPPQIMDVIERQPTADPAGVGGNQRDDVATKMRKAIAHDRLPPGGVIQRAERVIEYKAIPLRAGIFGQAFRSNHFVGRIEGG